VLVLVLVDRVPLSVTGTGTGTVLVTVIRLCERDSCRSSVLVDGPRNTVHGDPCTGTGTLTVPVPVSVTAPGTRPR